MGRLDTALNGKNSMLFGHKKITYECPECDPEYVPECEPGKVRDEATQQCIVPPCQPGDEFYECDCKCEEGQECRDGKCYDVEEPRCEEPYVWDPVTKTCVEPPTPPTPTPGPTPVDPPECGDCYIYDSDTGKCKWDITKCPESTPGECPNDKPYDDECGCCKSKKPEEPIPVTPEQDDCIKYTNVGNGVIVNEDGKITGAYGSSRLNGRRYWFSTDCIDRIEFYARITTIGEGANKSGIEHGYAEALGDMTNTVRAYYGDYVQLHHNDVLKIIIYSDGREDTYIKSFIRDGVWTDWELFSLIKKPEVPAGKIKWLMCGVLGGAEIWDIKTYGGKEITVLYSGEGGEIIHDITNQEITLTKSNGQSITIMDRNVGATKYYNESGATANDWNGSLFQWGNNYGFTNIPSTSKDTVDTTGYSWRNPYSNNVVITSNKHPTTSAFYKPDWSSPSNSELWGSNTDTDISKQGPCPEGYHIPNVYEALNLLNTWSSITGVDRTSYGYNHSRLVLFEDTLLLPLNGGIVVDQNNPYISRGGIGLLWTTTDTRYDNIPYGAAYRVAFDDYYIQTYTEGSSYMGQAFAKIWGFGIRPFKNKTDVPKHTITFVNYDGTVLQSSKVYSGLLPQYRGETPTKPSDQQYSYTFSGWSPEITTVSGDQTYTAQYTATPVTPSIMEGDYDFSNNSMTKDEIKALFNVVASGLDFNLTTDGIVPKNRSSSDSISLTTKNVSTGSGDTIQSIELWYEMESGSGGNNLTEILSKQNYMSHTNYASSYDGTGFFRPNISVSGATFTETTARYGGHHPSEGQIYIKIDSEGIYGEYKDTYYNHTLTYSYTAEVAQQFLELLKNNGGLSYLRIMPRGWASIKKFKYKVVIAQ